MAQRRGAVGATELMLACLPNRDTLSGWQHPRKPCPRLSAQNGMRFPDGMPSGNCIPESMLRMGRNFQVNDNRKAHPILSIDSGLQFPVEGCSGKCVPFQARIPGCTFRLKLQPESASHSERQFRDAVSAPNKRPRLAMELGPKAQHIQLMLSANSPSAMAVRAPPYPR